MEDKTFIIEFLNVYRNLEALWNSNLKSYNDKHIKNEQYNQLLRKYREKYPTATREDVAKKINILRTNYRKEVKRLEETVGDEAETSLYYYDAMSFINAVDKPRRIHNSSYGSNSHNETLSIPPPPVSAIKRKKPTPEDNLIQLASQKLNEPRSDPQVMSDGWYLIYKKLTEDQQMYAQKFISDILFEGQMGTLHRNSIQLNVDINPTYTHEEII